MPLFDSSHRVRVAALAGACACAFVFAGGCVRSRSPHGDGAAEQGPDAGGGQGPAVEDPGGISGRDGSAVADATAEASEPDGSPVAEGGVAADGGMAATGETFEGAEGEIGRMPWPEFPQPDRYQGEPLPLEGDCSQLPGAGEFQHVFEITRPDGQRIEVVGEQHTLDPAPAGDYEVRRLCEAHGPTVELSVETVRVAPWPAIVYERQQQLLAAPLNDLDAPLRLSPEPEPAESVPPQQYAPSGRFLYNPASRLVLPSCPSESCEDPDYEPLLPLAEGCTAGSLAWGPEGMQALASYQCETLVGRYWIEVDGNTITRSMRLGEDPEWSRLLPSHHAVVVRDGGELRWSQLDDAEPALQSFAQASAAFVDPTERWLLARREDGLFVYDLASGDLEAVRSSGRRLLDAPWNLWRVAWLQDARAVVQIGTSLGQLVAVDLTSGAHAELCEDDCRLESWCGVRMVYWDQTDTLVQLATFASGSSELQPEVAPLDPQPWSLWPAFDEGCDELRYQVRGQGPQRQVTLRLSDGTLRTGSPHQRVDSGRLWLVVDSQGFRLHEADPDGSLGAVLYALEDPSQAVYAVTVAPDDRELLFVADLQRQGEDAVYRLPFADLEPRLLAARVGPREPGRATQLAFSPDGTRLAVTSQPSRGWTTGRLGVTGVREYAWPSGEQLWTSRPAQVVRGRLGDFRVVPGRREVVFSGIYDAARQHTLFHAQVDTGARTTLTHGALAHRTVRDWWLQPGGEQVAVDVPRGALVFELGEPGETARTVRVFDQGPPRLEETLLAPFKVRDGGFVLQALAPHSDYTLALYWLASGADEPEHALTLAADAWPSQWFAGPPGAQQAAALKRADDTLWLVGVALPHDGPPDVVSEVHVSDWLLTPDARYVGYTTAEGVARVRDLLRGEDWRIGEGLRWGSVLAYDAGRLLTLENDAVHYFDLTSGEVRFIADTCWRGDAAASSDLRFVVVCHGGETRDRLDLVDVRTTRRRTLLTAEFPGDKLVPHAISPQQRWLVYVLTRSRDSTFHVVPLDGSGESHQLLSGSHATALTFDRSDRYLLSTGGALWRLHDWPDVSEPIPLATDPGVSRAQWVH